MAGLVVAALLVTGNASGQEVPTVTDPSKTIHGERSPRAPRELDVFAFLIGKWDGRGRTRLPDGKVAEYPVAWIGRYILDGTAIADEGHGPYPDGRPFLGITFRQYDQSRKTWVIEFLNVSESFLTAAGASGHWIGRRERPHRHGHLGITRHRRPRALCRAGRRQLGLSAGLIERRWTELERGGHRVHLPPLEVDGRQIHLLRSRLCLPGT